MNGDRFKAKFHFSDELLVRYVGAAGSEVRVDMAVRAAVWFYGEKLRNRRKELKMSQAILAEKIGVKQSYIARIEKGDVDLQLSSLVLIAGVLGLNLQLQ